MSSLLANPLTRRRFLHTSAMVTGTLGAGTLWRPARLLGAAPKKGGVLRVSIAERPTSLNPFTQINNVGYLIGEMMYTGITRLDLDMQPQPDGAESWSANDDATEFTFKLRDNLVTHNGQKLGARDAVAAIKAILDPETGSPGRKNVGPIKSADVVDELTFKVVTEVPYADLPGSISRQNLRLVPEQVIERGHKAMDTEDFGSGPFRLVSADLERKITFERADNYFDPELPYLDGVELALYPDLAAEAAAILGGETDIMLRVSAADFDRVAGGQNITGRRQETGRFLNFVLRHDTKPFDDLRVREALRLCLDRDALVLLVQEGFGRPAYDNVISPEYRYAIDTPKVQRNVDKAKQLLTEAGYGDGVKVTVYAANRPAERQSLAVAAREMAKPAGFDLEVQVIPYDEYIANVWRKAGCYVASWNMLPSEDAILTLLLTSDAPWHDAAWNNQEFDRVVYEARQTLDEQKRAELYAEAQRMIINDLPYLVPFYQDYLSAHADHVMDYTMHPLQFPHYLERTWLSEDAPQRG